MFFLIIFIICFSVGFCEASGKNDIDWNSGMVVLSTGESFDGELSFSPYSDVLLCRVDNKVTAYQARQVQTFFIQDLQMGMDRVFVSQEFPVHKNMVRNIYLEVVMVGAIPIYRKANIKKWKSNSIEVEDFEYYAVIDRAYIDLEDFPKKILPILKKDFGQQIKQFIKDNNIRKNNIMNKLRVISFYNSSIISDEQAKLNSPMYNLRQ